MAAISHEHVVPIYAVDEHAALPYIVMEYVPGGTLEHRLHREGPLEVVEVVRVALQVAAALSAAHRQGLIHRDIKPSNILLDQGTERVRVTDFGLARASNDGSFTRSGTLTGTPQYMAPEQIRGEACDAQSDLFSLGSVMYALFAGHPPFRGETVYAVMQRIVHDQPRSLREQVANIPVWLEDFIFRLLSKEKSDRFANADEVVKILEGELAYQQGPQVERDHPEFGGRHVAHRFRGKHGASSIYDDRFGGRTCRNFWSLDCINVDQFSGRSGGSRYKCFFSANEPRCHFGILMECARQLPLLGNWKPNLAQSFSIPNQIYGSNRRRRYGNG